MSLINIKTTWETLLAICGALALLAGGAKVILQVFGPFKKFKDDCKALTSRVDKHDGMFANDNIRLTRVEEAARILMKTHLAHLEHEITGNSQDKLKQAKQELSEYLLNK